MTHRVLTRLVVPAAALPEYTRRHEDLWPEIQESIRQQGGRNYSIWADPASDAVLIYLEVDDLQAWRQGGDQDLQQRWWRYMAEIMPTTDGLAPIADELSEIYHQA